MSESELADSGVCELCGENLNLTNFLARLSQRFATNAKRGTAVFTTPRGSYSGSVSRVNSRKPKVVECTVGE